MPPGIYEPTYAEVYRGVVNALAKGYRKVVCKSAGGVAEDEARDVRAAQEDGVRVDGGVPEDGVRARGGCRRMENDWAIYKLVGLYRGRVNVSCCIL